MNLKSLVLHARFCNFAVISVEIQIKQMKMKQKFLAIILMLGAGLFTACTFDDFESEPSTWEPQTEIWTVTIEPEFIIGYSGWGQYAMQVPQMEGHIENSNGQKNAEQPVRFCIDEISGFSFKEGYRYRLKIEATTTNPMIMDSPAYTFKLKEVLSTQYVGIRTEGRREVTMDVQTVSLSSPDPIYPEAFLYLSGKTIDGSETLDMGALEIYGANWEMFHQYDSDMCDDRSFICRMRLSITPAEQTISGKHNYRVRLEELISKTEVPKDSSVVAASVADYLSKRSEILY